MPPQRTRVSKETWVELGLVIVLCTTLWSVAFQFGQAQAREAERDRRLTAIEKRLDRLETP